MATQLQDLQAKRKELQATNPNATMIDARNALKPITNAPVAGQTNQNVQQTVQDLGGDVANRQNTRNVMTGMGTTRTPNGAIMNADGTVTQTPESIASNAGSVIVGNQYDKRTAEQKAIGAPATPEQAAQSTGGTISQTVPTPTQTTTQVTPTNPVTTNVTPTTPKTTTQTTQQTQNAPILTGKPDGTITAWDKTPGNIEYKGANQVISPRQTAIQQKLTGYAGKTSQQFVDLLKQGQIPSEISSQLAISNPEFQKAQQEYSVYRKNQNLVDSYKSVYNGMTGQETVEKNPLQEISDKMMALIAGNGTSYVEAFKQTIGGNEAIRTKTEALNATQAEINSKIKARDDYLKELKRNNPKASLSFLTAMAANQTQGLNEEILTLQAERDQQSADLKLETELAKGEFDAQMKDMERNQNLMQSMFNLQQSVALKQMDYAQQQNTPQFQTIGNKLYKIQNGQVIDTGVEAEPNAQFQQYGDKLYKIQGGTITEVPNVNIESKAPTTQTIEVGGKKVSVQWNGQEWTPVAGANIERGIATQTYGTTPAVRNFNPGNITDTGFGGRKVEGERFTVFDSPQEGFNALVSKIKNIQNGGSKVYSPDMTLLQYIGKYAPSSDGNNPIAYANAIAQNLGITTGTKIKDIDATKLAEEHAKHEDGNSYKMLQDLGIVGGGQALSGISALGQYMKDNQQRGPGYSEEDVKAFNEKIDRFVKNGDEKGIALAYRTNLFQDKDFKQEFDNTKKFTTGLDQVQKLIDDYEKAGKSTNALKGFAEKIARNLGLTTDQALAQMQTQMGFTLANYIKSISGTAASDAEVARLMGNMANISNVKDLNTTIISQVKNNADASLKSMIDTRMYGMPEELKSQVFSDVYKQAPQGKWDALTSILQQAISNKPQR